MTNRQISRKINLYLSGDSEILDGLINELESSNSEITGISLSTINRLYHALKNQKKEEDFWKVFLLLLPPELLSDELISDFITRSICLVELSHCDLKDEFLIELMPSYPEAGQTLLYRYYSNEHSFYKSLNASVGDFKRILGIIDNEELLYWLLNTICPDIAEKKNVLENHLRGNRDLLYKEEAI